MSIRAAMRGSPHLQNAWKDGLEALRREDKRHVEPADTRHLSGSAYVDQALEAVPEYAHANRWDYAIGYRHTNRRAEVIYWVEPHTADDHGMTKVLAKARWLRTWLTGEGRLLNRFEREIIWVSSGRTSFTPSSTQVKQFALLGLQHRGRVLRIPDLRPYPEPHVLRRRSGS